MELRDIEYFGVIAEHLNMRRAAQALGVTPPALSKSLRRLETAVEARLVQRTGRGVELTPFGAALAAQARRLRLTLADITREVADLTSGRAGHLRIGAGPTDCELLPAACAQVMRAAPRLTIDITISDNDELVPLIRAGKIDLALNTIPARPADGIEQMHVINDGYVAYASSRHPLSRKRKLRVADLVAEDWTMSPANFPPTQLLTRAFVDRGLPEPRLAMRTRSARLRLQFIAATRLLGFGSRLAVQMAMNRLQLKILPVPELTLPRSVGVMYRKGAYLPPAALQLIEALRGTRPRSGKSGG